jgi:hypothetical protein
MNASSENPPLPRLQEALLDVGTLEQLARDLQSFAQVDEVLLKGGAVAMTSGRPVSLPEALEALRQGRALGVQVRYRYDGTSWWDTLMRTPQGIRLVRIEHRLDG